MSVKGINLDFLYHQQKKIRDRKKGSKKIRKRKTLIINQEISHRKKTCLKLRGFFLLYT